MNTVTIKDGSVRLDSLTAAHAHLIAALDRTASVCQVNLVITCAREGHPPEDVHTIGQAFDVSVRGFLPAQIVRVKTFLEQILGPLFDVFFECPPNDAPTVDEPQLQAIATINRGATARHFHVQTKKNTTWPPVQMSTPGVLA